jgi:hypothetical protein
VENSLESNNKPVENSLESNNKPVENSDTVEG